MGPHHKKSDIQKKKEHYFRLYQSWKKIYCPALKSDVYFTLYGWKHIFEDKFRTGKEQIRRMDILPLARNLINISTTIQNTRFHKGRNHYEFQAEIGGMNIRAIVFDNLGKYTFKSAFIV
jgi:hypothetical protein